jgi:protein-S-isoprenylcysteine O-methyltransferase Ste14
MDIDELLIRRVAVCASAAIYWGGVAIQARRIRKRIGKTPNLKPRTPKEKILWAGWFAANFGCLMQPLVIPRAMLFPALINPLTLTLGFGLVAAGYAATLWCYASMGDTWRIGVNRTEKTSLVTHGPYRLIRHPIYGFQSVMLIGAALLLPTIFSLAIIAIHWVCVQFKAADEENYLLSVHGNAYREYLNRTGRLFPKLFA